jgi:hypothetical protein
MQGTKHKPAPPQRPQDSSAETVVIEIGLPGDLPLEHAAIRGLGIFMEEIRIRGGLSASEQRAIAAWFSARYGVH